MNSMGEGMAEQMERLKELIKERALLYSEEGFTLASSKRSHYYFDLKPILLDAEGLNLIAECMYEHINCLLYTSPSPRDRTRSRMPSSA